MWTDPFAALATVNTSANDERYTETRIKPTSKRNSPPVEPIRLHVFDLLMPPMNMQVPFVFKIAPGIHEECKESEGELVNPGCREQFESIATKLKASLAEALEVYPPVAGTIRTSADDALAMTIVCDGQGATFMTQVEDRKYVESEHWLDGLAGTSLFTADFSKPIFAVKLILFSCGTIVMITSMHHYAADLTSYMDFIDAWAQLSRGEDLATYSSLSWTRNFNNLSPPAAVPSTIPGIMILSPSSGPPPIPTEFRQGDGLRWFISDTNLAKLKADCMDLVKKKQVNSWLSSSDALTALMWGAMTRAQHAISNNIDPTRTVDSMNLAVNGRERIPGLGPLEAGGPSRYFGNLNLFLMVYTPRVDLLEASLGAMSRVALAIRKTLHDNTTPEAIAARVAFIEAQVEAKKQMLVELGDCMTTSWSKYDMTSFDFGLGLDVQSVGTTIGTKATYPTGMIHITRASGGLIVTTIMKKEADELLKMDSVLTRYAQAIL
ncbi:hypothetical protein BT96DRAFT_995038 [Gymnopus androsaceus JB14]|uniref:Transferase-domain-containing protein n=1 Tax=Gymnopus androsaceus JB14 TaxID=1447944 RepID=A0A6A4HMK9_9AGAR|nr:hypothetical protein BT96DRAFT_995038 [Gymnopus androsaceus JB14]